MTPKRVRPSSNLFDSHERRQASHFESSMGEIPLAKKKIKKDHISLEWNCLDQQPEDQAQQYEKEEDAEYTDLFGQQFYNLRACSFKTISKAGQDKVSLFGKNDVAQFDGQFQSAKKKYPGIHMSEEKLRYSDSKDKNKVTVSQRFIGFESMNQISKFQKKHSVDFDRYLQPLQKNRRRQSSIAGSLHTINTQMMNDIMEFNIKDENQIDQQYLKNMLEMALIKNVLFTANFLIKFLQRKGEEKQYLGMKFYKLLDVDGFSITGFYSETQKMRIKLPSPITNKQFDKKMSSHSYTSNQKHKSLSIKQRGVQFNGTFYRNETYDWEQVKFYLSDVKDLHINPHLKEPSCERLSLENFITIPQAQQCVQMSGNYYQKNIDNTAMK